MSGTEIVLHDISKIYGSRTVLQDLDLSLDTGECTVILGKSGCGKTTLLRLVAGLEEPSSGTLERPKDLKLGMMFQEARLFPWLTCRQNIALGLPKGADPGEIDHWLQLVQLTEAVDQYPHQLSGGMQQRASLARTLAMHSQLILMDEPFAALDYFTRAQLQQELRNMQQQLKRGIVLVTHNVDEALILGDRLLILQQGKIASELHLAPGPRDLLSPGLITAKRSLLAALA
ncbi:ABC transporter ATP-binding protein [Acidaminococcus timonensis]|uniref:ABC transporter ATP-binding protein n=1 Tax=Acidaminococcus timonensis TaxID=1871002 RepID=UPI0025FB4A43|nr:ABC transporter ATP-binding protein [Acidaminococcus timonensis]